MKKPKDLSALTKKITHKTLLEPEHDKFKNADLALGIEETLEEKEIREKVVRKSAAVTTDDLDIIQAIKDKCLNYKIVLNDSEVIRLSLLIASQLSEEELINTSKKLKKVPAGRPKGS